VKRAAFLLLTLTAVKAMGATAYVSDELVLNVFADENNQGQRLATLHSGAILDTLSASGDYTQVRLQDGTTGWVKSSYLTTKEPAVLRVKQLEEELERSRATPPAQAEAAARSELLTLQHELEDARAALARAPRQTAAISGGAGAAAASLERTGPIRVSAWLTAAGVVAGSVGGFCLGYATLARKVRSRFGGLRVY
jgi:uncharacterized protein YgiM (DUF1202 family)